MSAETDRAVESAVRELVRSERVNGVWYVNLPFTYPDGSFVTVRIDQAPGGVRVSDAGFAYRAAEAVDSARSFKRVANPIGEAIGVNIGDRAIFVAVSPAQLERAIADVAEVSWRVADRICQKAWDDEDDDLPEPLKERLAGLFGGGLEETKTIKGASTNDWTVSALVKFPDHIAVFQVVRDHAHSINKASTAFRDLSLLETPPRLVAVVQRKAALGPRLALLKPARVVEEAQPDEAFVKAAA